jgi:class 3 adenylate cyclase/tetratricopeptide (TPR) repeat protein
MCLSGTRFRLHVHEQLRAQCDELGSHLYARAVNLRSGIWAVVFTDLVGSTAQRARIGDQAADELRREHDAIAARAAAIHGGHVVKSTGDGSMMVFAGAADAVEAAVAIQQGVELRNRSGAEPFGLRVGISLGDLGHENDDLFGLAVNEAARVCARAEAGEILLSDLVRVVGASRIVRELDDLGVHELKGLPEPVHIWAASWDPATEPPRISLPIALGSADDAVSFAGRASELGELLEVWRQSAAGTRHFVLLSGEPGVGKTRLAFETARVAYDEGALVLYGHCDDDIAVPFQPFTEVIDGYFGAAGLDVVVGGSPGELARLSLRARERIAASPGPVVSDSETAQYCLFDAVGSWFSALAAQSPVVVVLDDVHWASKPTLLMLRHLLRATADTALLVVATYRDTDLDRDHALGSMLADLGRLGHVQRIALSGLDEQAVEALLERVANRPLDIETRELSRALHRETSGNAFFINEVLHHLLDTGAFAVDGIREGATVTARAGIPQGVKAILGERLTRLGDDVSHVLRAAAVVGQEFDVRLVAAASELADDVILDALDRTLVAGLVEDAGRGSYRFSHALVRSALLDELSTARRMRLHGLVASALEGLRPDDVTALAHHWCEAAAAGDPQRAVDVSREAARRALEQAAFDEAVQILERVIDLVSETGSAPMLAPSLMLDLGDARMAAGDIEAARDAYIAAADRPDTAHSIVVQAALSFGGPPRIESDARHEPLIRRALADLDAESAPELCAQLHAELALRLDDSDLRQREHVALAVQLGSRSENPRTRLAVHKAKFWLSCSPESDALREAQGALRAAADLGSVSEQLAALELCIIAASQRGGDGAAMEYFEMHRRLAADSHLRHFLDADIGLEARTYISAGNHDAAVALVQRALEAAPNEANTLNWASIIAQQMRLTDRHAELAQTLREWIAADLIPREVRTYVDASLALALADAGNRDEAREIFAASARNSFECLGPEGTFARPAELARLSSACAALGETTHASTLLHLLGPWTGAHLQLSMGEYCGPATLFIGRLERTCSRLDDAALTFTRAIDEAQAAGSPLKVAEARLELAKTLSARRAGDDTVRARVLTAEARHFAVEHRILSFSRQADTIDAEASAI